MPQPRRALAANPENRAKPASQHVEKRTKNSPLMRGWAFFGGQRPPTQGLHRAGVLPQRLRNSSGSNTGPTRTGTYNHHLWHVAPALAARSPARTLAAEQPLRIRGSSSPSNARLGQAMLFTVDAEADASAYPKPRLSQDLGTNVEVGQTISSMYLLLRGHHHHLPTPTHACRIRKFQWRPTCSDGGPIHSSLPFFQQPTRFRSGHEANSVPPENQNQSRQGREFYVSMAWFTVCHAIIEMERTMRSLLLAVTALGIVTVPVGAQQRQEVLYRQMHGVWKTMCVKDAMNDQVTSALSATGPGNRSVIGGDNSDIAVWSQNYRNDPAISVWVPYLHGKAKEREIVGLSVAKLYCKKLLWLATDLRNWLSV